MLASHGFVLCVSIDIWLLLLFIARYLLYSVVLVSAIHQHESATGIYVPSLLNLPPISHPIPPPRESQSSGLSSLYHRATFPLAICITQGKVYFHASLSIRPSLSFPYCVCKCILYACISIAALQLGSSGRFF